MSFLSVLSFSNFLFIENQRQRPCNQLTSINQKVPDIVRLAAPAFWSERPDRITAHGFYNWTTIEIHIGVIVSPAPRMTPESDCVIAMEYSRPQGSSLIALNVTSSVVFVKIPIRWWPKITIGVMVVEVPTAPVFPVLHPALRLAPYLWHRHSDRHTLSSRTKLKSSASLQSHRHAWW